MLDLLQFPFMQRALVAGLLVALMAAALGVLVLARRMTFFTDAIAHASLMGVAIGLWLNIRPIFGALIVAMVVGVAIARLAQHRGQSLDTLIGVFFASALSLGLIILSQLKGYRFDLMSFLFGDILAVDRTDLVATAILAGIVGLVLLATWKPFVKIAFSKHLAAVEGINVAAHDVILMLLLAAVVAVGMKLVGVVLLGGLIIIPSAAAKNIGASLKGTLGWSLVLALLSVIGGILLSYAFNTPTGPTIVVSAAVLFALSYPLGTLVRR